jgi:putative transposase
MIKRYNYRAYPTPEQITHLNQTFGSTRVVYNKYVETNKTEGKISSYAGACRALTELKKTPEYEWLNNVSSIALQQSLKDATSAVNLYFKNKAKGGKRRVGLPTFKKRTSRQAYRIVGGASYGVTKLNARYSGVTLPKLSSPLRFRMERELPSEPTSVTVIREPSGNYYVSFVVEVPITPLPPTDQHGAGDMGLTDLLITVDSNGGVSKVPNARFLRKQEARVKRAQRSLSRKKKGSKNREKARVRLAKTHARVTNQKKDLYYKLSNMLFRENQTFSIETLNITGMLANHKLARSISDASWGTLIACLKNTAAQYGRELTMIDQWYASSHVCHDCKVKRTTKLALSEREWACESCGSVHDRDINAALNILFEGARIRTAGRAGFACGEDISRVIALSPVKQELHSNTSQLALV